MLTETEIAALRQAYKEGKILFSATEWIKDGMT